MKAFPILCLGILLCSPAQAKKSAAELSEAELKAIAEQELESAPKGGMLTPLALPETGLVSTAEATKAEAPEPWKASEFEMGAQAFRPSGTGILSPTETYSYSGLSSQPMLLLGGRHWIVRSYAGRAWRMGLGMEAGASTRQLRIETSRGRAYDNVRMNSYLGALGPEAEIFLDGRLRWALGGRFLLGRSLLTQSTPVTALDRSEDVNIWEGEAHLRFQPTPGFFARLAFARRGILGATKDLGIQENNYAAFVGFGI